MQATITIPDSLVPKLKLVTGTTTDAELKLALLELLKTGAVHAAADYKRRQDQADLETDEADIRATWV